MSEYEKLESQILAFIEDEAASSFDELALAVHAFQKQQCGPLRAYCESIRPAPESWQDIPPIPTEAFKNERTPIISFADANADVATSVSEWKVGRDGGRSPHSLTLAATKTFVTSGTTGEARGQHHFRSLALYDASIHSAWRELGLPDLPLICLSQPPTLAPESSLVHMFATLGGRFLIGSDAQLDPTKLRALLSHTREPILLAGTALAFLHLFDSGAEIPPLPAGSYALETGGYKGSGRDISKSKLYEMFENQLGIAAERVINEYSMTELSSQFYSTGIGHPHRAAHWLRARVLKPGSNEEVADGETGVLAVYDLANLGSSVAIMTRDLAVRRGTNFELLGRDPDALPRGCSRSADELLSR